MSKEFWKLFLSSCIVLLDQFLLNVLLDPLLCFFIIWVGIHELSHSLLLLLFGIKLSLKSFSNNLFQLVVVIGFECSSNLWTVVLDLNSHMGITVPNGFEVLSFSLDLLVLLIVKQSVKHLVETHLRCSYILIQACEEAVQEVLVSLVQGAALS